MNFGLTALIGKNRRGAAKIAREELDNGVSITGIPRNQEYTCKSEKIICLDLKLKHIWENYIMTIATGKVL